MYEKWSVLIGFFCHYEQIPSHSNIYCLVETRVFLKLYLKPEYVHYGNIDCGVSSSGLKTLDWFWAKNEQVERKNFVCFIFLKAIMAKF